MRAPARLLAAALSTAFLAGCQDTTSGTTAGPVASGGPTTGTGPGVETNSPPVNTVDSTRARNLTEAINSAQFFALRGENTVAGPGQIVAVRFDQRNLELILGSGRRFVESRFSTIEAVEVCNAPIERPPARAVGNRTVDRQLNAGGEANVNVRRTIEASLRATGSQNVRVTALNSARSGFTLEDMQAIRSAALARPACVDGIREALRNPSFGIVCIVRSVMTADFTAARRANVAANAAVQPGALLQLPAPVTGSGGFNVTSANDTQVQGSGIIGAELGPICWTGRPV